MVLFVLAVLCGLPFLIILGYFLLILYMSQRGANYVRTPKKVVDTALSVLKPGDVFIDLGFGNGEVLEAAIQKGAAKAIGYELDFIRYIKTWWKLRHRQGIQLIYADVWSADLSNADLVFTFFTDIHMQKLYKKAKREMNKGSWFVSYVHKVPDVTPTKKIEDVHYFQI